MNKDQISYQILIFGIVQGVGYRPYVVREAKDCHVSGNVKNIGGNLEIIAVGTKEAMDKFIHRLELQRPKGAHVLEIQTKQIALCTYEDFIILESKNEYQIPMVSPDLPTCIRCERELEDKNDRRHLYPFISCISCGPRYSIIRTLPYDRRNVTMDKFPMCDYCEEEYSNIDTRRCHAQTIACHDCGPSLIWLEQKKEKKILKEEAYKRAVKVLKEGGIIAIKDIGGYHLACLADRVETVLNLRQLKGREKKPLAVMFSNLEQIKEYCCISKKEEQLLDSDPRPIVLLRQKKDFSPEVCGDSLDVGVFLPNNPLQILLVKECGPLIMTSANRSGEPIIIDDKKMQELKEEDSLLDGILYHTREILTPLDDSVLRVIDDKKIFVRRARGYVPLPIRLKKKSKNVIFAAGGDLKASFCLYYEDWAYLSQYFGDMQEIQVNSVYEKNRIHMEKLFHLHPQRVVCDMHPTYCSAKVAKQMRKPLLEVQHHHAHIASVIAEHGLEGKVLGIAFDGTGYGTDGAIWGGEFLLCQDDQMKRVAHLEYVTVCGGDEAVKNARLVKNCYLIQSGLKSDDEEFSIISAAINHKINTFRTSSMGRLFDGICALLKIKDFNQYESECATLLENYALKALETNKIPYPLGFSIYREHGMILISAKDLVAKIKEAVELNQDKEELALGFHIAIVDMIESVCEIVRQEENITQIALSGGVFLNRIVTKETLKRLSKCKFQVYLNELVPIGDGGICLGQAYLASFDS